MNLDKKNTKKILFIIFSSIIFLILLQHLDIVNNVIKRLFSIVFPFILGGAIAFILNVPMRALEKRMFPKRKKVTGKTGFRRPFALILTILIVLGVLTLAIFVIVPGIVDAVKSITAQLPSAVERLEQLSLKIQSYLPAVKDSILNLDLDWNTISAKAATIVKDFATSILSTSGGIIGSVVSGLGTFVIAIVFAIYILLQKEKLGSHIRQVVYAIFPEKHADSFFKIINLSDKTFSSFLSGQCVESCILGALFIIFMSIFKMPYAPLVGVLIAITALIPIIGAFIGCVVGALLIAIISPIKALGFVIMFLIIQQVEGNLIYPHVVGGSVGLPSIWVLAAVTLGGKLMGVTGILLFIPLCSVCYALFKGFVKGKLADKNIGIIKWGMNRDVPSNESPEETVTKPESGNNKKNDKNSKTDDNKADKSK